MHTSNSTGVILSALTAYEEERKLPNGVINSTKYNQWIDAMTIAEHMVNSGKLERAEFDDPTVPLRFHGCILTIGYGDFTGTEIDELCNLLTLMDEITIIGDAHGNVDFSCIVNNLYQ